MQRPEEMSDTLKLELLVIFEPPDMVLGTELESSGRTASALNYRAIFSVH